MASPNTLKLRAECSRRELPKESPLDCLIRRSLDQELWRQQMMRRPEQQAHARACREEMERIQGGIQ